MARKGASVSVLPIILLILLAATGEKWMVGVEGRMCASQSQKFKGTCLSDTNCANVCHTEGFPGGDCKGFRRRCFCTRPC